jgi:hypothetical protein
MVYPYDDELNGGEYYDDDQLQGSVMGHSVMGRGFQVVGARQLRGGGRAVHLPPRPSWRNQLAPGVIQPDEGLVPLPMQPLANGGIFNAAGPGTITFQGDLQKPYRPERLLVSVVRTGTTATGRLLGLLWVGTDLQQGDIFGFDIELFGSSTAFGTRLTCKAAQPGVKIRMVVTPTGIPTGTDSIFVNVNFAGRIVH